MFAAATVFPSFAGAADFAREPLRLKQYTFRQIVELMRMINRQKDVIPI